MKKVYKLQDTYFNIEFIKKMSNLKIINKKEVEESLRKAKEEKIPLFSGCFRPIQHIEIVNNYEEDCREAVIMIDDKNYYCENYTCDFGLVVTKYSVVKEKQRKYNRFVKEAREMLAAFKELEVEQ